MLSAEQKQQLVAIASLGCDRLTSSRFVGASTEALRDAIDADAAFAEALVRAEAQAELAHMKNVHNASQEEKNWRVSAWWLERCRPERYAPQRSDAVSEDDVRQTLDLILSVIDQEVADPGVRRRIHARLAEAGEEIEAALEAPPATPSDHSPEAP